MWLNPSKSSRNLVWRHPWPLDIITDLILSTNLKGNLTNSNLELAAIVLHEDTLLAEVPAARMAVLRSGLDNLPTISWRTHEASTINLVVANLLRIRTLYSRKFFLNPSFFTTQDKKISWQMMPLDSSIYLTPLFLPTCLSPPPPPSRLRNCFLA